MFDALSGGLSSANAVFGLLKSAVAARDQTLIDKHVAEMAERLRELTMAALEASQEALAAAQAARKTDLRIAELEAEVRRLQSSAEERDQYELVRVGSNTYAYARKDRVDGQETHYLCQACYDAGKKVVLQRQGGSSILKCPACSAEVRSEVLATEVAQAFANANLSANARRRTGGIY